MLDSAGPHHYLRPTRDLLSWPAAARRQPLRPLRIQ